MIHPGARSFCTKALYAAGSRSSCAIWMRNTTRKMAMNTLDSSRIMKRKYLGCFSHQLAGIFGWNTLGLSGRAAVIASPRVRVGT
jgi:hypothetical protein